MTHYRIIDDLSVSGAGLDALLGTLPSWRSEEARKFRYEGGRRECAVSYLLLCDLLLECFGIDRPPLFVRGEHGKPELLDTATHEPLTHKGRKVHFNLSHCKHAIACVVSDEGSVGIDVECLGRYKTDLAEYCMSDEELQQIASADDADTEFTLLWTKKEALLKFTGEGITDDIKGCLTSPRAAGTTTLGGCNKEKGYAWALTMKKSE